MFHTASRRSSRIERRRVSDYDQLMHDWQSHAGETVAKQLADQLGAAA
jgi:hypothetical protein